MTDTVAVAVAQVPARLGDVRANLDAMDGYLREAAAKQAKLLVLPECYLSGYMFDDREHAVASAISIDSDEISEIGGFVRQVRHRGDRRLPRSER